MTTKNSNNKDSATNKSTNKSTKKSKADLVEQYLQILLLADNDLAAKNDLNVAAERILASLNSLADSDTGNPISIDGKIEILDLMKKRAQAQQQEQQSRQQQVQQQNASVNLLVAIGIIDRLKNRIEHDFQEQYQKYYGQHSL